MKAVENNWMNNKSEKLTFTTFGISYVTIRISFEMDPQLSENITSNITAAVNLSSDFTLEVIGFQPSCKCDTSCVCEHGVLFLNRNIYSHLYKLSI